MTSKELIEALRRLDPEGNIQVAVGNFPIMDVLLLPASYDGCLQLIEENADGEPIRGSYQSSGKKLCLYCCSIRDAVLVFDKFQVDYSGLSERLRNSYEQAHQQARAHQRGCHVEAERRLFIRWAIGKGKLLSDNVSGLGEVAGRFFDANLSIDDFVPLDLLNPVVDDTGAAHYLSHEKRRFAQWDRTIVVMFNGQWEVSKL
jgi:hypothetical protein